MTRCPPFNNQPATTYGVDSGRDRTNDALTREGAADLAQRIRRAWAKCGYLVEVGIEMTHHNGYPLFCPRLRTPMRGLGAGAAA